tara:strand:+ start:56964 stop:58481 length:1518 start_codon:yes stop_codon:yes gene_type:complete
LALLSFFVVASCGDGDTQPELESLELTPGTAMIVSGTTQQFTAMATLSDGTKASLLADAIWESSDTAVATVDQNGLASAVAAGSVRISLSSGDVSTSATVTVADSVLESVVLTPGNPSIAAGTTQAFVATGTFSDTTTRDISSTVTWSSSDEEVATVSSAGVVTSTTAGSAAITATSGEVSASATVTVTTATLASLFIESDSIALNTFVPVQFTATGVFSDFTLQDMTNSVTWTSSDASTVSIGATGLASGTTIGDATLTATSGTLSDSSDVTVERVLIAIDNALSGSPQMYGINPTTGAASHIGPTTDRTSAIAFDASGTLISLSDNGQGLVSYDLVTGGVTVLDDVNYSFASDMAITPDGRIYGGMNNEGLYEAVAGSPRAFLVAEEQYENNGALAANSAGLLIFQDFDISAGNFVSLDPDSLVRTDLGFSYAEAFGRIKAMTFIGDTLYAITQTGEGPDGANDLVGCTLITISSAGVVAIVGTENGLPTDLDALAYFNPTVK